MIKVSIVVPIYNCEDYLSRCVESLLKQSLQEIEIILIDDGSSDGSWSVCQKYASEYENIKVKHIENSGATQARSEGIKMASGEYIGFLDSDDWVEEEMYDVLYKEAKRLEADIIQCNFKKVDCVDDLITHKTDRIAARVYSSENALKQLLGVRENVGFNFLLWNKIYRAEIIKKIELPVHIKDINDVPVIPRVFYEAKKIAVMDTQYVYYFMRNDESNKSTMDELKSSKEKFIWTHIEAFEDVSSYFRDLDEEIYLASLRNTVAWSLSALKANETSKKCKKDALRIIKKSKIWGNKYIPIAKKVIAIGLKVLP